METPVLSGFAQTWVPRKVEGTASRARPLVRERIGSTQRDCRARPPTKAATLHAHRAKRYVSQRRPVALFLLLSAIASALTLAIMIAVPWHLETTVALQGSAQRPSRIAELALLQGDALLAAACWPHECALVGRR